MRKLSLLSTLTLYALVLLLAAPSQAATYKMSSYPNVPLPDRGKVIDNIYFPTSLDIAEVRVGVYCLHSWAYDVMITLRGPNGQSAVLKSYGSGTYGPIGSDEVHAMFIDGGGSSWNATESPALGQYNPVTPLSVFGGIKSNGWWTIILEDGASGDRGHFVGWDLLISGGTVVPPITLFSQNGRIQGWYGGNNLVPPTASGGGAVNYGTNADIYNNSIAGSGITIGTTGPNGRMTIYVDILHTWVSDLDIYFGDTPGPNPGPAPPAYNTVIDLSTDNGGGNDDMILTFDDAAANPITGFGGSYGLYSGRFSPEQPLSTFNGQSLDGHWWLDIYDDASGDNGVLNEWRIDYEIAGYNILAPIHEAIANPLIGVFLPAGIAGAVIGYVPDIVSTIPPYSVTSKQEQPTFAIWTNEKQWSRYATGFERVEAVKLSGGIPYTGYWGPYAYSTDNVTYVNADLLNLQEASYRIRTTMNSREDDDLNDNVAYSAPFDVTPATLSYAGERMQNLNQWQITGYNNAGYFTLPAGTQYGMAFTVFKIPSSRLTSVDLFLDSITTASLYGDTKIVIYPVDNVFIGNPVNVPIAESPMLIGNDRHLENWYTYPIGPIGVGTGGVNLPPGTYVISLQIHSGTVYHYRFFYQMSRVRKNGYWAYAMSPLTTFGPLLPTSLGTTKLFAYSTSHASAPTSNTNMSGGNAVMSFRANFVTQNDFAIEKITPRGTFDIVGAPFTPTVTFKSASPQNGNPQGFNGLVKIFNAAGQKVYESEKVGSVIPYGQVDLSFNPWTPAVPGQYLIEASFSRNPLDQNPVNDKWTANLVIYQTGVGVIYDDDVSADLLDATRTELERCGTSDAQFINRSKTTFNPEQFNTIFWIGKTDAEQQAQLRTAIAAGTNVGYVMRNNDLDAVRTITENSDKVFQVQREHEVDYANLRFGDADDPSMAQMTTPVDAPKVDLDIRSKEDLLKYFMQSRRTIEQHSQALPDPQSYEEKQAYLERERQVNAMPKVDRGQILPPAINSPFGDIKFVNHVGTDVQFIFAIPERATKREGVTTTAGAPTNFALEQNYPNPFNPTTTINYTLPEASHVNLAVFDVLGREITRMVNFTQSAGRYTIQWKGIDNNGQSVSSGIYFYRLEAAPAAGGESFISMKKMTLSK